MFFGIVLIRGDDMSREKKMYIFIHIVRFLFTVSFFVSVSLTIRASAYYIAQRTTNEVSEDVIRIIHIALSVLAYHSLFRLFITTDAAARNAFCNSGMGKLKYILTSFESLVTLILSVLSFVAFPNAFAVKSLWEWLEIPHFFATAIMVSIFAVTLAGTWIECLFDWTKVFEKEQKEKRARKETWPLIKGIIGICLAYPIMAYIIPIIVPTLATLPDVVLLISSVVLPALAVLYIVFNLFDYVRAFAIRFRFFSKLKKAARKNKYKLSKIKKPYMSVFADNEGENFTITANGKTYLCKLLCGLHYGNEMHFKEEGKASIIKSLRLRVFFRGRSGLGRIGWHNGDELARMETHISYAFDGAEKKVLIICPTPHSIYATVGTKKKLLDVNDKVYGYTIMTGTAFINALERDAVK